MEKVYYDYSVTDFVVEEHTCTEIGSIFFMLTLLIDGAFRTNCNWLAKIKKKIYLNI